MAFAKSVETRNLETDIYDLLNINFADYQLNIKDFTKTDIAFCLSQLYPSRYPDLNRIEEKVGRMLLRASKNRNAFVSIKSTKRGHYALCKKKPERKSQKVSLPNIPDFSDAPILNPVISKDTYLGKAGEMAVCSELLYRDYNISLMSVDDGIDVVAIKSGKTFLIQVKTMTSRDETNFQTHIKKGSFNRYNGCNCFYVFVARKNAGTNKACNKFIVMAASNIQLYIDNGIINDNPSNINISFQFKDSQTLLLCGKANITSTINNFNNIR